MSEGRPKEVCPVKIPTLWGVANTAPYFHDNSARDLGEVLDQYNFAFARFDDAEAMGCDPDAPQCLSEQDKADIIAYLQLLSFEADAFRAAPAADVRPHSGSASP